MIASDLSEVAIERFADAVFDSPEVLVLEAYSEYDIEALQLSSKLELVRFIQLRFSMPDHHAFFFVVYPDMIGKPIKKTIHLDQRRVREGKIRYTWEGWGLISVMLEREEQPAKRSNVASSTAARALKWQSTHTEWPAPSTWNWKAVSKHTRRLQRVLENLTTASRATH